MCFDARMLARITQGHHSIHFRWPTTAIDPRDDKRRQERAARCVDRAARCGDRSLLSALDEGRDPDGGAPRATGSLGRSSGVVDHDGDLGVPVWEVVDEIGAGPLLSNAERFSRTRSPVRRYSCQGTGRKGRSKRPELERLRLGRSPSKS